MFEIVYFSNVDASKTPADRASANQASTDDEKLVAALDEGINVGNTFPGNKFPSCQSSFFPGKQSICINATFCTQ